ncbi:thymidine kinase [Bombilactobacillus thymidiniphilus]|uniref:Thymidine kinase n=1 Tax=Bombilactobacillus thymidiniphilus TaxID=2923363 RepID=A0ABY4PDR6_9LACO|nr:thymidine kinase [Bombilactobacillus thymidiniphilus]UQS83852.1 thymidine kinase [Bombilactobacillus thymidiniphilus]
MAQLFFRYGAMNAGKSIEVIKVAHNYEEQGKHVLLLTSKLDTRSGVGKIASRIGLERAAVAIDDKDDLFAVVDATDPQVDCVLVDEVQFLSNQQVQQLAHVVDELEIPVMGFGLKNDSRNQLFPGSEAMLLFADKIEEMKTICWFCSKKATMNLRVSHGQPNYGGSQIQIDDGHDAYYPVCRKDYFNPPLKQLESDDANG